MFTESIDFIQILPFAVFGLFAAAAWWLLQTSFMGEQARAEERLDEWRDPNLRLKKQIGEGKVKSDPMSKLLEKASPALSKPLQPKTEADVGKLKLRLSMAGFRSEAAPAAFLSLKFAGLIGGLFIVGGPAAILSGFDVLTMCYSAGFAGFLFFAPDLVVWFITKKRQQSIFLSLPDALDLLVVCVEAGLGLDQAMRKVSDELKQSYRVISDEFALCNFHLQMGRPRDQVLHDLGARNGVDDLRSLAAILIQAEKFGSSIAQALRVQSDSMRTRRRQLAEEKAAKTAVKLIFPLVIFIFPGIFVVLVGPAAVTMVNEMFPAMTGAK